MNFEQVIRNKLISSFSPAFIEVQNESHGHSVAEGAQTHFKVTLVGQAFEGVSRVQRHQLAYQALQEELANGVHALALHIYTESEWADRGAASPASPQCAGK